MTNFTVHRYLREYFDRIMDKESGENRIEHTQTDGDSDLHLPFFMNNPIC